MKTHPHILIVAVSLAALAGVGCQHRVVTAAMPAPLPPHPVIQSQTQPDQAPPPVIPPASDPAPQAQLPSLDPAPAPAAPAGSRVPANPRSSSVPADANAAKPNAESSAPEAPVIVPALSQKDLFTAMRQTNNDQSAAQKTLDRARSRRLDASQADLFDKVKGFLDQAEEAKHANDWVRAQNLAHKARILALELMKSL